MKIPNPISAVIFDLDGTLVQTESVHCEAWLKVLAKRGFHYDEYWFEQWIGTADRFLAQGVIDEHQLTINRRVLQLEKEALFYELVVKENQAFSGIETILKELSDRLPIAIATNSSKQDTEYVFRSTPINRFMKTVVTSSDVKQLKPDPEIYLLAAAQLGVPPSECLVLEDSPAGSEAGTAAGMYVLGLCSSQPKEKMTAAQEWFATPQEGMKRILELTEEEIKPT
ncbi:MAG: HAD family hydrolase [Lewinella sp.]|uniref:HAD family hydrolase n=1 Tax=Lewinella sp. TaxID=2004506 RepID=UPI003D6A3FE3